MRRATFVVHVLSLTTLVALAAAPLAIAAAPTPTEDAALQHARKLLKQTILVDGHNDLPWEIRNSKTAPFDVNAYDLRQRTPGDTDIERLRRGGLGAQFWSVYVPGEVGSGYARMQLEQIDIARRVISKYPDVFQFALTSEDIRKAHKAGRIASLMGMEGGHAIENSLGALRAYYDLGARYMTLTHNVHTDWADCAALPPVHNGLTPFGEEVVREMNRLGMLVDLSHVSPDTMRSALRVSKAPVMFSHSSARALTDVPRNVPDDVLLELKKNGGVVMVTFVAGFIDTATAQAAEPAFRELRERSKAAKTDAERDALETEILGKVQYPKVPIDRVADHIEHIRDVAGVDHIGLGGDFDGNEHWPEGLQDVADYPNLFAVLIRRGWNDADLKKLAGENILHAFSKAEAVAAELQKTTQPSTMQFHAQ
jgi:membrane dipeptidase